MEAANRGSLVTGSMRCGMSSERPGSQSALFEDGPITSTSPSGSRSRARSSARPAALLPRSKQSTEIFTATTDSGRPELVEQTAPLRPGTEPGVRVDVARALEDHHA